jgi:hypothetical protein
MTEDQEPAAVNVVADPGPRPRPHAEPSLGAIESLVQSIEAREAAPTPRAAAPAPREARTAPPRSLVVVGGPSVERRAPAVPASAAATPVTWVEHRPVHRPAPAPQAGRLIGRAEWDRLLAADAERGRRYGRPSAIVLVELGPRDRRDPVVDAAGLHRAMVPCGKALLGITRASDRVAILGDRHFGVLLRESDTEAAELYASRAIAACDPWLAASARPLRLRVACASTRGGTDVIAAVRYAERRLHAPGAGGGRPA